MGGPTYSGKGVHRAVRIQPPKDWIRSRVDGRRAEGCLFCGRIRSTDHIGTIWLESTDAHIIESTGHSQNDQSEAVKELAQPTLKPTASKAASEQGEGSES